MNWKIRSMLVSVTALAALMATPLVALASDDFGQHVADCAQTHGFDGEHNPGMHEGKSGWPGTACVD